MKPIAESCIQNQESIAKVVVPLFSHSTRLLEVGSGTGQHAVYLAKRLPHLTWVTSDLQEAHSGILAWMRDEQLENVRPPVDLDVTGSNWPTGQFDAVFSANTTHIMSWPMVECFFAGVGKVLESEGVFTLYGPFNYAGSYTSESNRCFDGWLKSRDPDSGIRDFEKLNDLAERAGMYLYRDFEMPENNRILCWKKSP
jgi:cyclopropane fatty-acyl-phospholipid synthase-like methyltransferase